LRKTIRAHGKKQGSFHCAIYTVRYGTDSSQERPMAGKRAARLPKLN
jgi:hypothetical protein